MSMAEVEARVAEGSSLLVIDGLVHDVSEFLESHPAGPSFIRPYLGKDATSAFRGGVYNHSHAADNTLRTLRVAQLQAACE